MIPTLDMSSDRGGGVMTLAQRPCEEKGERGSNSFFAQKIGKFIYLNQENPLVTCFLDVGGLSLALSLPLTVPLGLNFEDLFFLEGFSCRIIDYIWQGRSLAYDRIDMSSLIFLIQN